LKENFLAMADGRYRWWAWGGLAVPNARSRLDVRGTMAHGLWTRNACWVAHALLLAEGRVYGDKARQWKEIETSALDNKGVRRTEEKKRLESRRAGVDSTVSDSCRSAQGCSTRAANSLHGGPARESGLQLIIRTSTPPL